MDITSFLYDHGIESEAWVGIINATFVILVTALSSGLIYFITKKWVASFVMRLSKKTKLTWDDIFFDQKFFNRLGMLFASITAVWILSSIDTTHNIIPIKIIYLWVVFSSVVLFSAVLGGVNRIYESYPVSRDRPIRVFIQLIMIFVWCAAAMIVISIFTGMSLTVLLGGLTAFAAVLMLIFQDSILGFVAGIQLSANNMVRIGDWIVMPNRGVDGDVIEINLTTVKVQNWDKTITTIPTHKLVSESFTNWRGMEESRGRRIKRSINIDVSSIHYLTDEELETLKKSALLGTYIEKKIAEINEYNANRHYLLDERRLTNVGTFREYLEQWLANNPNINTDMTHMVRQLQPGPTGLPLEIYCFSAKQGWIDYENVQSDIFDHIYAVIDLFGLRPFQYSGSVITNHN